MATLEKIKFDILNQAGNILEIQTAFVQQARQEGWKPHEIAEIISESMARKSIVPLAQWCEGIGETDLETLRAKYVEEAPRQRPPRETASGVVIVDIDLPFSSMVVFMVKAALAAIPAVLILGILGMALRFMYLGLTGSPAPR